MNYIIIILYINNTTWYIFHISIRYSLKEGDRVDSWFIIYIIYENVLVRNYAFLIRFHFIIQISLRSVDKLCEQFLFSQTSYESFWSKFEWFFFLCQFSNQAKGWGFPRRMFSSLVRHIVTIVHLPWSTSILSLKRHRLWIWRFQYYHC